MHIVLCHDTEKQALKGTNREKISSAKHIAFFYINFKIQYLFTSTPLQTGHLALFDLMFPSLLCSS